MSSGNPYAATASHPQRAPKKKKWLWWLIGGIVLICVIVGAVLGGVLGTRSKNSDSGGNKAGGKEGAAEATGTPGTAGNTAFATGTKGADGGNTALPSLLSYFGTNMAAQTQSGANGQIYMAVATDTYMLPAYVTGVSLCGGWCMLGPQRAVPLSHPNWPRYPTATAPEAHAD